MPGGQEVAALVGSSGDVVDVQDGPDGLVFEPLPRISRIDSRHLGELRRRRRTALLERLVQPEPLAEVHRLEVQACQDRAGQAACERIAPLILGRLVAGVVDGDGHRGLHSCDG